MSKHSYNRLGGILFTIQAAVKRRIDFENYSKNAIPQQHTHPSWLSCHELQTLLNATFLHFLKLWPDLELKGVSGATGKMARLLTTGWK